jgi:hypothetical protein
VGDLAGDSSDYKCIMAAQYSLGAKLTSVGAFIGNCTALHLALADLARAISLEVHCCC